eukprot:GGOE01004595.1.p1 GENE.GGOE01004595.1~~GGOE01004595.1.p1  ORF type:complete len:232 (-),score=22.60 GGOE01004595.1:591-1247(-)
MAPTAPPGVLTPHRPEPYRENANRIDGIEVYRQKGPQCLPPPLVLGSLYEEDTEFGWIGRPPTDVEGLGLQGHRRVTSASRGGKRSSSRVIATSTRMPHLLSPYDSYHPSISGPAHPTYAPSYCKGPGGIYRQVEPEVMVTPSYVPPMLSYPSMGHPPSPGTFINPACSQCRREWGWREPLAACPIGCGCCPCTEPYCSSYPVRPQRLIEDRQPARRR